jgi:hypothetical protein
MYVNDWQQTLDAGQRNLQMFASGGLFSLSILTPDTLPNVRQKITLHIWVIASHKTLVCFLRLQVFIIKF